MVRGGIPAPLPRTRVAEKLVTDSYEVCTSLGLTAYGAFLLISRKAPQSLVAAAPHWVVVVWACFLVFGGAATLAGMLRGSLGLEAGGLVLVASASVGYAAIIPFTFGVGGLAAVCFSASIGVGALIRAYSIWVAALTAEAILRESD
jgi:hypothetical protein